MTTETLRPDLRTAIDAALDKQAGNVTLLDLTGQSAFTDYFLLCTGYSTPQVRAICDEIEEKLKLGGLRPLHREGRDNAEWLLLDYGRFIVHVFTERLREYYDLERLWRNARRTSFSDGSSGAGAGAGARTGFGAGAAAADERSA
jgi:ribosome-associated protein